MSSPISSSVAKREDSTAWHEEVKECGQDLFRAFQGRLRDDVKRSLRDENPLIAEDHSSQATKSCRLMLKVSATDPENAQIILDGFAEVPLDVVSDVYMEFESRGIVDVQFKFENYKNVHASASDQVAGNASIWFQKSRGTCNRRFRSRECFLAPTEGHDGGDFSGYLHDQIEADMKKLSSTPDCLLSVSTKPLRTEQGLFSTLVRNHQRVAFSDAVALQLSHPQIERVFVSSPNGGLLAHWSSNVSQWGAWKPNASIGWCTANPGRFDMNDAELVRTSSPHRRGSTKRRRFQ